MTKASKEKNINNNIAINNLPLPEEEAIDEKDNLWWSLKQSPITMISTMLVIIIITASFLAPIIAPHNPYDPSTLDILDSSLPPFWIEGGSFKYFLGTDNQGRDVLSNILYGTKVSISIGIAGVALSSFIGIILGLLAGYKKGWIDNLIMRIADVHLTFPTILVALMIDGIVNSLFESYNREKNAFWVIVLSIGMSSWVQYARTIRASTMVEATKDYVSAANLIGIPSRMILIKHILPNVLGPILIIATVNLALAILTEATLSFLGVGIPPTQPSLGTMLNIGQNFLFSGEWWITAFPGLTLATLILSINLVGDWLRDTLNPKLR